MKAKLFRKLKVFGITVGIYKAPGLLENEGTYGFYADSEKKIAVDASLKGDELEITVLHEMFHAVLDRLHCSPQMSDDFAEVVIENLSRAVIDNYRLRWRE